MSTILTDDDRKKVFLEACGKNQFSGFDEALMILTEAAVLAKLAQQEPVAWHTEDHLTDRSATTYSKEAMHRWQGKGWPVTPLYTHPAQQQADRPRVPTIEELTEKIASMLHGTYHCTRVWEAWNVGTMSEEDFGPVDESDTPAEIAAEIHVMLAAAPEAPAQASAVDERDRKDAERYRWLREQHWTENLIGVVIRPKDNAKLGSMLPSLELLDDTIDHMKARAALEKKGGSA